MLRKIVFLLIILDILFLNRSFAQQSGATKDSSEFRTISILKAATFTGAYYTSAMLIMQNTWYRGRDIVPFHFFNDNSGYLQLDKFGHAYAAYLESSLAYNSLIKAGMPKNKALLYGGTLGFFMQAPIEIMDGIHEGWGFSWGDLAANAFGSGLLIGQELLFQEQILKFKFSNWESPYARNANGYLGTSTLNRLLKDYNGHTYWFSWPMNRTINKRLPGWIAISVGYSANGMYGEFENITEYKGVAIPPTERYRQYLLSLDVDWTKVRTNSKILKLVFQGMNFIKLPFPALEFSSKGGFRGYWLYF